MKQRHPANILIIIPARGGSKGIPRKNLRILNKKPLLYYSIHNGLSSTFDADVYVSSENQEILSLAQKMGASIHQRPEELSDDKTTLDPVIYDAYASVSDKLGKSYELIVTLQPTSPLLKTSSLDGAIQQMLDNPHIDTLLSATQKVGLSWKQEDGTFIPNYKKRLNRQQLDPVFYETGGFLICRSSVISPESRFGIHVQLYELSDQEAIDIDTYEEWNLCAYFLNRKKIVLATLGYPRVGLGHIYRTLLLADRIVNHDILFILDDKSQLGFKKIQETHHPVIMTEKDQLLDTIIEQKADLVITDRLDTTETYVEAIQKTGARTIHFEDLGPGSWLADVVFNAIYSPGKERKGHYYGPRYFCGRQEFLLSQPVEIQKKVKHILLTFGGTDPNNLTLKTLNAIYTYCQKQGIQITVIAGLGYRHYEDLSPFDDIRIHRNVKNISDYMMAADIAFTSAGRTTYELAMLGVPTIVQAQNEREQSHFFASGQFGFINLGLGKESTEEDILNALINIRPYDHRLRMHRLMLATDLRLGIDRVMNIINSTIESL